MMRRTDVFGDGLVLREFEDGAGLGLVAMLVRRRGVGRVGGGGSSLSAVWEVVDFFRRRCVGLSQTEDMLLPLVLTYFFF